MHMQNSVSPAGWLASLPRRRYKVGHMRLIPVVMEGHPTTVLPPELWPQGHTLWERQITGLVPCICVDGTFPGLSSLLT